MEGNIMKARGFLKLLALLLAFGMVAAACGDSDSESSDTTAAAADASDSGDSDDSDSGLPDLDGRTVSVGVENAYLPFQPALRSSWRPW